MSVMENFENKDENQIVEKTDNSVTGTIVDIDYKTRALTVLCTNNMNIKFSINHLKNYDRPFTSNYIKREIKIGDII